MKLFIVLAVFIALAVAKDTSLERKRYVIKFFQFFNKIFSSTKMIQQVSGKFSFQHAPSKLFGELCCGLMENGG